MRISRATYPIVKMSGKSLVPIVCVVCGKVIQYGEMYSTKMGGEKHVNCKDLTKRK